MIAACLLAMLALADFDLGPGLLEADLEVAIVDARQDLPSLHRLVVVDQHRRDVAGDAGSDRRVVGLDIGVVGRDLEAADRPVLPAEIGGARDDRGGRAGEQQVAHPVLARRDGRVCNNNRDLGNRSLRDGNERQLYAGRRLGGRKRLFRREDCLVLAHGSFLPLSR